MTVIDHRRAVLYGGISGETALDDLHILDMAGETRVRPYPLWYVDQCSEAPH